MVTGRSLLQLLVAAILACAAALSCAQSPAHLQRGKDFAALAKEARARQAPIVIAFVRQSCGYCAIAKRDYLVPMEREAGAQGKVIVREVDIEQGGTLSDFGGRATNPKAFSLRYRVGIVPTVVVVDDRGELVAPPIVGLLSDDFYGSYLQQAIEAGRVRMRTAPRQGGTGGAGR